MPKGRPRLGANLAEHSRTPRGRPPSLILRHDGVRWGVAVLHDGKEIAFLEPKEARREAMLYIEMAWLASHPGECPRGIIG